MSKNRLRRASNYQMHCEDDHHLRNAFWFHDGTPLDPVRVYYFSQCIFETQCQSKWFRISRYTAGPQPSRSVEGDDSVCKSPSPEPIQYRWHVSKKLDVPSYTLVDGYATPASEAAPAGRELSCLKLIPVHAHDIVRLRSLIRVPNDDDHSCRLRNFTCDDVPSETFFFDDILVFRG